MKVRIGIDVGGTFTDAVALDNDSFELVGMAKVPTTHSAAQGVAAGIIEVLHKVMEACHIQPQDVAFIAHGTTQATNALLEGDVVKVGILTMGSGLQGMKSRADTHIGNIELASGKFLSSENVYVDSGAGQAETGSLEAGLSELQALGAQSIVAAEAFSVDEPTNENRVLELCRDRGLPGTATNEISKLYGLKIRTRTAVVNASIMPKMLEAANMTEKSIEDAQIKSPLMIMRCDGGVMSVAEVRNRPILTILSGPAAGVAGALMYEKLTDGLFFEVGGTSTDISCVKDGKVMIQYAEIGGHKTYLNSLDVRTVGIGGGSMVQLQDGKAVDIGPRSAHIAGVDYEVYADAEIIQNPRLTAIRPMPSDPEYAVIDCDGGVRVCLTMAGAANILGYAKEGDYAYGNVAAARAAWAPLAERMGCTVEEAARRVMNFAAAKNGRVARQLMADYHMNPEHTVFVGGGGGAAAVVPQLAEAMGHRHRIAKNAPVISTIGVALAMVREMVERTVSNPTQEDVLSIRREAEQKAIKNGAAAGTIEISVEVDAQKNLIRAIAVGATELRQKQPGRQKLSKEALLELVADNLGVSAGRLYIAAQNEGIFAVQYKKTEKKLFGMLKKTTTPLRLIDEDGVIRLQKNHALVVGTKVEGWQQGLSWLLEEMTEYNDGGANVPNIYLILGKKLIDLSGLSEDGQIRGLGEMELGGCKGDESVILIGAKKADA